MRDSGRSIIVSVTVFGWRKVIYMMDMSYVCRYLKVEVVILCHVVYRAIDKKGIPPAVEIHT